MSDGIYDNTGYHNRRSIRLRGYDYSRAGMYFVTLCIHHHAGLVLSVGATGASPELTGVSPDIVELAQPSTTMNLTEYGAIVCDEWERSFQIRSEFKTDEYVIMPDHMHAIIRIGNLRGNAPVVSKNQGDAPVAPTTDMRGTPMGPKPRSTGTIKRINELNKTPGEWVWQRNYYEHIIRNEQSLFRIRQYIRNNPIKWFNDPKNHLKNEIGEFDNNDNA